jgi:hypothetical protein
MGDTMSTYTDRRDAYRLLSGLENGNVPAADLTILVEQLDPVLIYLIFSYLRAVHPASDPAASAILERVVHLTSRANDVVRKNREGGQDVVSRWFESEHTYRDFKGRGQEMVDLIVDKLEG